MRIPIALQLYSIRHDCERDLPGTLKAVAEMGYEGVEFAGYYGRSAAELRAMLDDLGLAVAGTHIRIETLMGDQLADTVAFNRALAGWIPGSLTWVTVISCAVFTAFTGASGVTIVALGGLLLPALLKDGYSEKFSLGLVTGSGCIGLLFPPSIPVILYGIVARVEIEQIFMAGLVPGLLILK